MDNYVTILGLMAATLTTISFLPQALKTWKTKKTKDISLPMYIALTVGILLWFIYGLFIQSIPVIAANAVSFIFTVCILILKLKHG